jgi:hypothetical protein
VFDRFWMSKNGFVPGIKIKPLLNSVSATVVESKMGKLKMMIDFNNLHKIFGHCSEASARLSGNAFGYEAVGTFYTCKAFLSVKQDRKR